MKRALLLLALLGCDDGPLGPGAVDPAVEGAPLDPIAIYARASLDLRGVRPSLAELEHLDAEPGALPGMLDDLLADPRFAAGIKDLFAPAFRTRVDTYADVSSPVLTAAIAEEPLDLIAWIALNDRPYTDLVLAEHTLVAPGLLGIWPLEAIPGDGIGRAVPARYTDGRPAAGVLTMNSMWWRHPSTVENANRGRANALSDALLCESWLDRPIAFPRDVDLTDSASIHRAIRANPACAACHQTLDPLAAHLWGFMYRGESLEARARYSPAQERDWRGTSDRPPGFYGQATRDLRDLAVQIARDERFVACAVRRVYQGLMARPLEVQDDGALAAHREVFLAAGLQLKALVRSVLDDPAYRGLARRTAFGGRPAPAPWTLVTPRMLAEEVAELTGYRFRVQGQDLLAVDYGLRAVAGGSDRGAATDPSTGLVLVQRRLAEGAAAAFVAGATSGSLGDLLPRAALDARPTAEALQAVLWLTTLRRVRAGGPEIAALLDLWDAIDAHAGEREAWVGLLTAILADPERLLR